jgi:hypothetical protein
MTLPNWLTEVKWLAHDEPYPLLGFVRDIASERKLRLVGCAACRRIWELMHDPRCRVAVEASERFAEGLLSERGLDLISAAAEEAYEDADFDEGEDAKLAATVAHAASYASSPSLSLDVVLEALGAVGNAAPHGLVAELGLQADSVRDIFGNPLRPVTVDPRWLTSDVVALARGIYDERAFDRLPILADALQDAGCDNADVLGHCRDPQLTHVRGCWVVDLVLGKS